MKLFFYIIFTLLLFNVNFLFSQGNKKITLVIDAGHGGNDSGKPRSNKDYKHEKDLNLILALEVGKLLEKNMPNLQVFYTRKKDVFVELKDRADFANKLKADYMISIHCNSSLKEWVSGTNSHVHENENNTSYKLAKRIQEEFKKNDRLNRGIVSTVDRQKSLYVLKNTEMPAVLIETGYLSNPYEEHYLNSVYGQNNIAKSIYTAFKDFATPKEKPSLYKVQIMASAKPISLTTTKFAELDMLVEEFVSADFYGYKYLVGDSKNKLEAKKVAKKVKSLGFPEAFVVKVK